MLKQQVTISTLMAKWALIADYHYHVRRSEMEAFFNEAVDGGISEDELIKYKDRIISLWCPLTWSDAKKKHPYWSDRKLWENLKEHTMRDFREIIKERVYAAKSAIIAQKEDENTFDNVEDMLAWAEKNKKRVSNGNG